MAKSSENKPIGISAAKTSIKIDKQKENQLNKAIDDIVAHINPLKANWNKLGGKKQALLNNSPILKRIVNEIVEVLK